MASDPCMYSGMRKLVLIAIAAPIVMAEYTAIELGQWLVLIGLPLRVGSQSCYTA